MNIRYPLYEGVYRILTVYLYINKNIRYNFSKQIKKMEKQVSN